ncbi:MAG: D-alanine--D-alanine ligase [Gammaproteobacteria bacterium]|nr:D-alanine--D-alanine ligase [Gammaproteobacteria bacterium]
MIESKETYETRNTITNPSDFGQVAVMLGGSSSEREISLKSGTAVLEALKLRGVDAYPWDPNEKSMEVFSKAGFDRVWIALHGTNGEDGVLQDNLQRLNTPYTGSGVTASAIAMNKVLSKNLFSSAGIPTPNYVVVNSRKDNLIAAEQFGFPLIVKPSCQGSSVGMSLVFDKPELNDALDKALGYGDTVLVEKYIHGDEITVSILQGEVLPSIRIITPRIFYDYHAKYESDRTEYICKGTSNDDEEKLYADIAINAFQELGCRGWGRVDFMTASDGQPQVLEVNTVPGMTKHSLVPMAAQNIGIDFTDLCWRILETSFTANFLDNEIKVSSNGT